MSQNSMNICQTCGSKGYLDLLIHCVQCEINAVHRYCVDGPSKIDEDEVIWSCEDCVPRKLEANPAIRKSERNHPNADREALRRKCRKNWTNSLNTTKVEKSNCVKKGAIKEEDDSPTLAEKKKKIVVESKPGKLKKNKTASKMGDSEPSPLLRPNNKKVNSDGGSKKERSNPSMSTGKTIKDLNPLCVDGEELQPDHENNLGSQQSEESDHGMERANKDDEIRYGDSVVESFQKHGQSSEIHSSILDEQREIGCSRTSKQFNDAEDKTSDNFKETKAVPSYNMGQTRRKRKRLVISMEYSDSDDEPVFDRADLPQISPNVREDLTYMRGEPSANIAACGLDQRTLMKSYDQFPTQVSPNIKSDNYIPPPKSSVDDKRAIPALSNTMSDMHVPAQPITNALPARPIMNAVLAQPIMNAVWRGYCSISNDAHPISLKLEAHISTKAHEIVLGAASALPNSLSFEIVPKHDAWPKSFEKAPPAGDMIGLYLFPVDERDEKRYDVLIDKMIEDELMLKSHINNLELLVFCSQELPREEWRFQGKYYLWSVFKPFNSYQEVSLTSGPPGSQISNSTYYEKNLGIAEKVGVQRALQA